MRTNRRRAMALATTAALALALAAPYASLAASRPGNGGPGGAKAPQESVWTADSDCASCHPGEQLLPTAQPQDAAVEGGRDAVPRQGLPDAQAAGTGELDRYAQMHAETFGFACTSCHEPGDALATAHARATSAPASSSLRKTSVSSDVCTACHKVEDLVKKTEGCVVLTDSKGRTVNPHDLPDVLDHGSISCADCHEVHSDRPLERSAVLACTECHHAGVYECYTCHQ